MYEKITFEELLKRMLDRVIKKYPNLDTREGSLIYNALAPAAVEIKNMYIELDSILNNTFADTASREFLIRRASERGIEVEKATNALRLAIFTPTSLEIPIGARFSLNLLNYRVVEKIEQGRYKAICEQVGYKGNVEHGTLIPINYIDGLETATLADVLIPGEDEETTEHLRQRYFDSLKSQAFGGNIADYKQKVNHIDGVGGVKVYPVWNADLVPSALIPPPETASWISGLSGVPVGVKTWLDYVYSAGNQNKLTVGGTVKLVIINSDYGKPTSVLVNKVQTEIDPEQNHGEGLGVAPIGHVVTVVGCDETVINIQTHMVFEPAYNFERLKTVIEKTIDDYFKEISVKWANETALVVRISQIESRLLDITGVLDISKTLINGSDSNIILDANAIPKRGVITNV